MRIYCSFCTGAVILTVETSGSVKILIHCTPNDQPVCTSVVLSSGTAVHTGILSSKVMLGFCWLTRVTSFCFGLVFVFIFLADKNGSLQCDSAIGILDGIEHVHLYIQGLHLHVQGS